MTETLKVEIDISRWTALVANLPPSAMQNAWRRTLRKTMNWVKSQVARDVSAAAKIPMKIVRERLYFFLRSSVTGKVWLGLNAIEADRLGTLRQTRSGVTVGRHRFPGAWIYRGEHNVNSYGKVFRRVGRARIPYERVKVDWTGDGEAAFQRVAARAEERLLTILEQEIRYEIHKAVGNAR